MCKISVLYPKIPKYQQTIYKYKLKALKSQLKSSFYIYTINLSKFVTEQFLTISQPLITFRKKISHKKQYIISIVFVIAMASSFYLIKDWIGYRVVALLLMFTVSVIAMLFDIFPVLIASILSALIWDFFFIPPQFTLHIDNAEDLLMFLMYFIIAMVNAVLTFKIREQEKKLRDKEEKESAIKLYNTLFNSLSHELRTPISTIIAAIDTLKENKTGLSDYDQNDLYNEIDTATLRLNRQVDNLLNMSRLESAILKPKTEWCDLNELIFSVIQKFSDSLQSHTINFKPTDDFPLVNVDLMMMEQIISNIVHNGIHYTPENSIININTSIQDDKLIITINDNGKGFPESEIPLVFNKFHRLPNARTGGSGLGLSIVKGFVNALNGTISLENQASGGAIFKITIPCEISYINNLKNE